MDINCRHCGEPFEVDALHDVATELGTTFEGARERFYAQGCAGIGYRHNETPIMSKGDREAVSMMQDLLGDDVDGLAATLEDMGLW